MRPGVLLDRDGVINEEVEYLHDPKDLVVIPGTAQAVAALNARGVPVAVVTNQAGIGRGMYGVEAYLAVNRAIDALLARSGAHIDGWYFCPHLPGAGCACRKPLPGMIFEAARDLQLDLRRSVLVGDKASDLESGRAAGCLSILVRTGYGRGVETELQVGGRIDLADHVCDSLIAALPYLPGTL